MLDSFRLKTFPDPEHAHVSQKQSRDHVCATHVLPRFNRTRVLLALCPEMPEGNCCYLRRLFRDEDEFVGEDVS